MIVRCYFIRKISEEKKVFVMIISGACEGTEKLCFQKYNCLNKFIQLIYKTIWQYI